jgi:hypothetical protein
LGPATKQKPNQKGEANSQPSRHSDSWRRETLGAARQHHWR